MITIIFAVFAVICLGFIAYLLNIVWELDKYNNKLQSKLAFAGKNYIEKTNELKYKINKLEIKIIDQNNSIQKYKEMYIEEMLNNKIKNNEPKKCKKQRKPIRKSSNRSSKGKVRL